MLRTFTRTYFSNAVYPLVQKLPHSAVVNTDKKQNKTMGLEHVKQDQPDSEKKTNTLPPEVVERLDKCSQSY